MSIANDRSTASRRRFLATASAASLALAAPAIVRGQGRKTLKVSVGRQPWAAGNSPVTAYMMNNKTFERFAGDAGYDLTVDYRDYPSALPMVEAFVSGNLDFGMWGNTPIVRLIAEAPTAGDAEALVAAGRELLY
jgi:ABC-type nitrate/sulfonate/bicarbonate transport system substrate-binding protein